VNKKHLDHHGLASVNVTYVLFRLEFPTAGVVHFVPQVFRQSVWIIDFSAELVNGHFALVLGAEGIRSAIRQLFGFWLACF
jgi:hypothetical protein